MNERLAPKITELFDILEVDMEAVITYTQM